jgi:hypothetical protein
LPVSAKVHVFRRLFVADILWGMKKLQKTKRDGYCRRLIKQLFFNWIKNQSCDCEEGIGKILEKLQDLENSIELIAGEMARKARRND